MASKKKDNFVLELIDFYKDFTTASANAIRKLAKIQRKHKSNYKILRDLSEDPETVNKLVDHLDDEQRQVFLDVMLQSHTLSKRSSRLIHLNPNEQEKLAKDLEKFGKNIEKYMKEMKR